MTLDEMQKEMRKLEEAQQDRFIDNLKEMVDNLCEKLNKKSYNPTIHEYQTIKKIRAMLDDIED